MSSENEDQVLLKSPDENKPESQKVSKILYTRDFLLSLSEFDVCKKLPSGFNSSILSEFEEASRSVRGEYASASQGRLENSGSHTRANQGRWETRSSGSSDKDGDSQPDRESIVQDSGRRFGNQLQRGWQNSEHDGLLGNGAFPRPTGYAGSLAPKARGNSHYQLNRSTEPYQPPRPYKAMPYSKKDYTDSFNDETFGSAECSSEDRAEEERKRRALFESMRKEQQKALQEKHKQTHDNQKESLDSNIIALLGNSAVENSMTSENKSDNPVAASLSTSTVSLHIQAPASRPLAPPGFSRAQVEKNLPSLAAEAGTAIVENRRSLMGMENNQDNGNIPAAFMPVNVNKNVPKIYSQLSVDAIENHMAPMLSTEVLQPTIDVEKTLGKTIVQGANEVWEDDIIIMDDSSCKKGSASEITKIASQDHYTSILEKLFSSALSKEYASTPNDLKHQGIDADEEKWGRSVFESSKFSHCFSEEEKKTEDDFSSRELLSLVVTNEEVGSQMCTDNEKASEHIPLNLAYESLVTPPKLPTTPATSLAISASQQYSQCDSKSPSSVVVLTCEDLEQSILAEVKDASLNPSHSFLGGCTSFDGTPEKQRAYADDSASHHLLSLLQKGANYRQSASSPRPDIIESTKSFSGSHVDHSLDHISKNAETVQSSEQTLTLEALFGASFMNALHSAEAPVSAQRGPVGRENSTDILQSHGVLFPQVDNGSLSATSHEFKSNKFIHEGNVISLNNTHKDHTIPGHFPIETSKLGDTGIEKVQALDIQLPEEDSLITIGDTLNSISTNPFSFENVQKLEFLPEDDRNAKFLNAILRDGELSRTHVLDGAPQLQKGPLEMVDPNDLYYRLLGRPSSQFPHQMDESRPLFPPFDHLANRNPQMKFTGPDNMHHDPRHLFPHHDPQRMPHHAFSNIGAPRFDNVTAHHPMLQRMPVPENIPPHNLMHGFPRGVALSQPINHMHGYMPEMNNMHNFPLHNRQPTFSGGHGSGLQGPGIGAGGGNPHNEAFERLIEMEMRAKSKQFHPPMGAHIPGIYGHENINFRYR